MIDLRARPPRRWSDRVDGIVWLGRLVDKARAFDAGTLGLYLYGQSPVDGAFLRAAGLDYAGFLATVREASDDAGVLAAIERRAPGATGRLRDWSARPPLSCRMIFHLNDADEGYTTSVPARAVRAVAFAVYAPIVGALRALFPLRRP